MQKPIRSRTSRRWSSPTWRCSPISRSSPSATTSRCYARSSDTVLFLFACDRTLLMQDSLTISETLFEALCDARGIPCRRIPVGDQSTPDYEIVLGLERVIVEVKQLDPNED